MGKRWKAMYKRWAGLCLALLALWMLLPAARAANDGGWTLPNLTGNTTIGIETIGPSSPPDWYDFTVTVQDEEGNLLEGVIIHLYPVLADGSLGAAITGIDGQYMTDQNGQLTFRLPPPGGLYQIDTQIAGYEHYISSQFQLSENGTMVVTLKKQQSTTGGDVNTGDSKPDADLPATGDQSHLHWYILLCMAMSMAVGMGRLWYLRRFQYEAAEQTGEQQ